MVLILIDCWGLAHLCIFSNYTMQIQYLRNVLWDVSPNSLSTGKHCVLLKGGTAEPWDSCPRHMVVPNVASSPPGFAPLKGECVIPLVSAAAPARSTEGRPLSGTVSSQRRQVRWPGWLLPLWACHFLSICHINLKDRWTFTIECEVKSDVLHTLCDKN